MPIPATLIIDDGAPLNLMHWHDVAGEQPMKVPLDFTQSFADLCRRFGVKGKFSVVPMPAGAGRIDEKLGFVTPDELNGFLRVVREEIAPSFDITPEILTHLRAVNLATGGLMHIFEDEWFRTASVPAMTEYMALAFRILRNAGLDPTGITSPWDTGIHQEPQFAEAVGRAYYQVTRRTFTWYFLHCLGGSEPRRPWISWQDPAHRLTVATVPALTDDAFWGAQTQPTKSASRRAVRDGVESLLSRDGTRGKLRELYDGGYPLIILTHWQSLFAKGWRTGLEALGETCARIERVFGEQVRWTKFSEVARMALK